MATQFTVEWVRNDHGTPRKIGQYAEELSQTFKKGAAVVLDATSKEVEELAVTAGVPDSVILLAFALEDATGTAGSPIDVCLPQPGDVFRAAVLTDQDTLVAPDYNTDVGENYALIKMSATAGDGDEWGLERAAVEANPFVRVLGLDAQDASRRGVDPFAVATALNSGDRLFFSVLQSVIDTEPKQ